jgi:ATP-dependent Clp protease ATP-binding subunit ClpA
MPVRKRKVDSNTKNALVYMQDTACNRGTKLVDINLFVYSIMRACGEYMDQYVPADKIELACVGIAELLPKSAEEKVHIDEIEYSPSIFEYVSKIESEELSGVISILSDVVHRDESIKKVFEDNGIFSYDLDRASKFEVARKNVNKKRRVRNTDNNHSNGGTLFLPQEQVKKKNTKSNLEDFCTDMTDLAKKGVIGDVFCRDDEIGKVIVALLRKVKSNPLLIGEPGVGKTAIVEGLAAKIASGDVPDRLKDNVVMSLDIPSVIGGTTLRGEFEDRMKGIMSELQSRSGIILFIDEIHMIVGAGDHSGSMDAGNILKPYLARGDIKCIGATTHHEYNKYMRKDGALVRRFQRVTVDELSEEHTLEIMRGLMPSFEEFHGVKVSSAALKAIVRLSGKHIVDRYLPDKAIDCLDEACARAVILDQDVCQNIVEESMADLASIPVGIIRQNSVEMRGRMISSMKQSILGNDDAIDKFCTAVSSRTTSVSLNNRPLCTVLLKGPKGVGKKTCVKLAASGMFGSRDSIVKIDGADYSEPHSVSKIVGSPPGYVGYAEEGVLKDVKRNPHSVVMILGFDIMHHSVREQIFRAVRDGNIKDSEGNLVDFRSCTVIFVADNPEKVSSLGFGEHSYDSSLDKSVWGDILDSTDATIDFDNVADVKVMREIANMEVESIVKAYEDAGETIEVDSDEVDVIFEDLMPCSPSRMRRKVRKSIEMKIMSDKMSAVK